MSIKKIALGFALAGIVGATNAVAEQSGSFLACKVDMEKHNTRLKQLLAQRLILKG